jgi:hypothetical protein
MSVVLAAAVAIAAIGSVDHPWTLGAETKRQLVFLEGDASPSDLRGWTLDLDVGYWFSGKYGAALVFEGSLYNARSDRLPPGSSATSFGLFLEGRANTNPEGPFSFRVELGGGIGRLALPSAGGSVDRFIELQPLRLHIGPSYTVAPGVDLVLLAGAALGWFKDHGGGNNCAVTATCTDSMLTSDTESHAHFVADLAIGLRFSP